ncbi:MAG: hypothetical protein VYE22_26585 [Myxococcota bacterium]|nr:hypothetical protein [Myxococcota bacterium]
MTDFLRPTFLGPVLGAAALGLAACGGGAPPTPETAASPAIEPVADVGAPGCGLDVSPAHDRQIVAVLEESSDLTAAARRYEVDAYGVIETSGFATIESVIPPEGRGGEQLAMELREELEETGVLALPEGCYAEDLDGPSARVIAIAIPHEGRILHFATREGEGPLPLLQAAQVIRRYVERVATYDEAEMSATLDVPQTRVDVIKDW